MSKSEVPIPIGWRVIIAPKQAKDMSSGGIDISASVDAEQHLIYIGQIVAMGEACFTTKTPGGIDLGKFAVKPQVGDWVIYPPYGGIRIRQSGAGGGSDDEPKYLLLFKDSDLQCIIEDPDNFYSWLDS